VQFRDHTDRHRQPGGAEDLGAPRREQLQLAVGSTAAVRRVRLAAIASNTARYIEPSRSALNLLSACVFVVNVTLPPKR